MPMSPAAFFLLTTSRNSHTRPAAGVASMWMSPTRRREPATAPPDVESMRTLEVGTLSRLNSFTHVRQPFQSSGSRGSGTSGRRS